MENKEEELRVEDFKITFKVTADNHKDIFCHAFIEHNKAQVVNEKDESIYNAKAEPLQTFNIDNMIKYCTELSTKYILDNIQKKTGTKQEVAEER